MTEVDSDQAAGPVDPPREIESEQGTSPAEPARGVESSRAPAPDPVEAVRTIQSSGRSSSGGGILGWFLCRPEIDEARRGARLSPREDALVARAQLAFATANHLLEVPRRPGQGRAVFHAAALFHEALYWCLLSSRTDLGMPEFDALWDDPRSPTEILGLSAEQTTEIRKLVAMKRPALELAELPEAQQEAALILLRYAAHGALEIRERPRAVVRRLAFKSLLRIGVTVAATVLLLFLLVAVKRWTTPEKVDIAAGKTWTQSSKWADCDPAAGKCGTATTKILFHTHEEEGPWVQYDLGQPMEFSSMMIKNRQDGYAERAVPLVVEVSDDGKTFREVIRQDDEFSVWEPEFDEQKARYVRLRAARKTILHLEEVQIHP